MKGVLALESFSVNRYLRKHFIERTVVACKVILLGAIALFMVLAARSYLDSTESATNRIEAFKQSIAASKEALEQEKAAGHKDVKPVVASGRSIFGDVGAPTPPPRSQPTPKPASNLPMTLVGTFITRGQQPYAIIEEQKKKSQDDFVVGDTVFGEAKLVAIYEDRVEIERNGQIEILALDSAPERGPEMKGGVGVINENEFVVDEGELDRALENLPLLLTQARAVPFFKEGRAVGLRLFAIKAGSLFERIGLQNGDVLKAINGNSLADLSQALQLFQRLKEEKTINVVMERNMTEKEVRYYIK